MTKFKEFLKEKDNIIWAIVMPAVVITAAITFALGYKGCALGILIGAMAAYTFSKLGGHVRNSLTGSVGDV